MWFNDMRGAEKGVQELIPVALSSLLLVSDFVIWYYVTVSLFSYGVFY